MPATEVPSTAPNEEESTLARSLAKITGSPLSRSAGTSTGVIGYDPSQTFRPTGDVINISAAPGTGASTPETWAHEISLENLKREQLQFEFTQQQAALSQAMKEAEAARSAQAQAFSQGITSAQAGREAATAAQQAALAPYQLKQAQQSLSNAQYDTALKKAQAEAAQAQSFTQLGGMTLPQLKTVIYNTGRLADFAQGAPVGSPGLNEQFAAYARSPQYNQTTQQFNPTYGTWSTVPVTQYYKPPTGNVAFNAISRGQY